MSVRGIFASHSSIVGDRQTDLTGRALRADWGGIVPMTALSAGCPVDSVTDTSYTWREEEPVMGNALLTAAATNVQTTLTVDGTSNWVEGAILQNLSTGEQVYVTAISGLTVTVTRGFAGTTAAAMAIGHRMQLISTAFAEASRGTSAVMPMSESRTSYVQILKGAYAISGTATAVKFNSGDPKQRGIDYAKTSLLEQIERASIWGRPSVSLISTPDGMKELRTTMGLLYAISNYGGKTVIPAANSVPGRLNLRIIFDFMRTIFARNIKGQPNERLAYCGFGMTGLIQQMVLDIPGYNYSMGETKFGIAINTLTTPDGELKLMTHPMFNGVANWQNELIAFHPGGVRRKVLRELQNIPRGIANQPNALDAETGDLLIEMGFEWRGAVTMGAITGSATAGGLTALPKS